MRHISRHIFLSAVATILLITSNLWAQYTETGVYQFHRPYGSAAYSLVADSAGNFYGVTTGGGNSACAPLGCGVVFKISNSGGVWKETVLHQFTGGSDGDTPTRITLDSAGNIYGIADFGGVNGSGVVFKMTPRPTGGYRFVVLHSFPDNSSDGQFPSSIVLDAKGNVYGATTSDPAGDCGTYGCGVIFRLSPTTSGTWSESILYHFNGTPDGMAPSGNMFFNGPGTLYGTTNNGGNVCNGNNSGCGTIYRLTYNSGSWTESTLYAFSGTDGEVPNSLIQDASGNLFTTTLFGGIKNTSCTLGCGTVFELSPSSGGWTGSSIYQMSDSASDGSQPNAVITNNGNLYAALAFSGQGPEGVIIELSPSSGGWTEAPLFVFNDPTGGADPTSILIDASGNIFGTTLTGGDAGPHGSGDGVFFELSP
ncbi:MAG TPA: choice-of-anchor tandem repeat GloVer-containing protein [Candidatus Sulfotelmatobacter sp.]